MNDKGRTVWERSVAAVSSIMTGVFNDSFCMADAIEREFADVVETDPRVIALVEAARLWAYRQETGDALSFGMSKEEVAKMNVALQPFIQK